jgi:hypothetical protein
VYLPGYLKRGLVDAWKLAEPIRAFVFQVFVYIHSTRRTICFVDSTIGAVVGYCSGSAIIGALVGGMLGILNYELVTVRWLKLAPAKVA